MPGLASALKDTHVGKAAEQALGQRSQQALDISGFDTLYLGSPIWLYSPAPPLWQFVDNHRFDGQRIVLFNTYNSHFDAAYIADLRQRVMARGARSFEHVTVLRGRMPRQIGAPAMLATIEERWLEQD